MTRRTRQSDQFIPSCRRVLAALALFVGVLAPVALVAGSTSAGASTISPYAATWCTGQSSTLEGWTGTTPNLPICGPGPAYGGTFQWITAPDPYGGSSTYYNATPGFQCVELADRFLSAVAGLAPVKADGATVAANYHAAYPSTTLVVNGSRGAVGHAPVAGDVISFSSSPDFFGGGDGHVAVVVSSAVNSAGNGTVQIAQENVGASDYLRTLDLVGWRLTDPEYPGNAEFQFSYAEWLLVPTSQPASSTAPNTSISLVSAPKPIGALGSVAQFRHEPSLLRLRRASSSGPKAP